MPEQNRDGTPAVTRRGFGALIGGMLGGEAARRLGFLEPQRASAEASLQVLPPSAINIEKDPAKIAEITRSLISKINQMFPNADSRVNATGYRISNGWHGQDGFKYIAFQRVIFQEEPNERLNFWNTLDNMSEYGLDVKLDSGELGVTVPPMQKFNDRSATLEGIFAERIAALKVPDEVVNFVKDIRRVAETGVFTAYKKYGEAYEVWRYQRGAVMKWNDGPNKGLTQGILAGDAAAAAGLIPKDVLLDKPDLGSGGSTSEDEVIPVVSRAFQDRYVAGNSEIINPTSGQIGWKERYEGGLALVDEMVKDVGLTGGIKFVESPGLPKISGRTGTIRVCQDTNDPRCQQEFLRWMVEIDGKTAYAKYDFLIPDIIFKPGDREGANIGLSLTGRVPDALGQDANSPKWLEWRRKMIESNPLQLAAPVQLE